MCDLPKHVISGPKSNSTITTWTHLSPRDLEMFLVCQHSTLIPLIGICSGIPSWPVLSTRRRPTGLGPSEPNTTKTLGAQGRVDCSSVEGWSHQPKVSNITDRIVYHRHDPSTLHPVPPWKASATLRGVESTDHVSTLIFSRNLALDTTSSGHYYGHSSSRIVATLASGHHLVHAAIYTSRQVDSRLQC